MCFFFAHKYFLVTWFFQTFNSFSVSTVCLCSAVDYDIHGDGNIWSYVVRDLQDLERHRSDVSPVVQRASSVCYEELGCFDKNGTFKHVKTLPEPPETVSTQFLLYTKKNPLKPQPIDYKNPETIKNSNFDSSKPVKFITHGFGGKNNLTWLLDMKNAFLKKVSFSRMYLTILCIFN